MSRGTVDSNNISSTPKYTRVGVREVPTAMKPRLPEDILDFARSLRLHQTDAENLLRSRSFGFKFRRQHPVDRFILDFYCHEAHLAVELDGGEHNEDHAVLKDECRSAELLKMGIHVLRFWNDEVLLSTEAVLERIFQELIERSGPHPCPSPGGRGDISHPK
jgi:very-short-patch-repair endonuclease